MKNFKELRRSKGWIVVLATIVGISLGAYAFVNRAVSTQVYVTNCDMQDYKPESITKFCADGGVTIASIEWESWSKNGASGKGIYYANDCEPSCAEGKFHEANVVITLSKIKSINGKPTLTFIDVATEDKKELPLSDSWQDGWPLELAG